MFKIAEKYSHDLDGWPICWGSDVVAVASYRGGTEPARKLAEQIVLALNGRGVKDQYRNEEC